MVILINVIDLILILILVLIVFIVIIQHLYEKAKKRIKKWMERVKK